MKKYIFSTLITIGSFAIAQVGIGTNVPTQDLEVNGTFKLHEENNLFLENPGYYLGTAGNSILLVKDKNDNHLKKFDPSNAGFASASITTYKFTNVDKKGLVEYDTKINASKYYVSIGGFVVYSKDDNTSISIAPSSSNQNDYFPLYSARSFVKNGTWHLKFMPNNGREFSQNINVYLDVSIYLRKMLTKTDSQPIVVDFNNGTTGSATKPQGIN